MSPRSRKLLAAALGAAVLVSIALEILVPADHGPGWISYWFHHTPGFHAAMGFTGCWLIVKASKLLGKVWLQRPEDYYGEADPHAEAGEAGAAHGGEEAGSHAH